MSLEADILVAGAGIAGLRAAIAAAVTGRGLRVVVLAPREGPSGSSFANGAGSLGVLAPANDAERDVVGERALSIAAPGTADPVLVRLMLEQGEARLRELAEWGVPFMTGADGALLRRSACFLPEFPVAAVIPDLAAAHAAMMRVALSVGVDVLPGFSLAALCADGGPPGSGLCLDPAGAVVPVRARAVLLAAGGPASLFTGDISGAGQTGAGLGFARACGARTANASFLQFMWYGQDGAPFPFLPDDRHELEVAGANGVPVPLPPDIRCLMAERATHAPWGWAMPDEALDRYLLSFMTPAGVVPVRYRSDGVGRLLSLHAHAGNGGAVIDADGRTTAPGLFACGECATGMHGANRLGGGMVLAAQVFGHRAGVAAALHAASALLPPPPAIPEGAEYQTSRNPMRLKEAMQRHCLPGMPGGALAPASEGGAEGQRHRQELELFADRLKALMALPAVPLLDRARVLSALTVVEHRLRRLRTEVAAAPVADA